MSDPSERAIVLRGDARSLPLPGDSVDLIVTSPPYWALRSYTDNGEHYAGQIGSEPTPAEWVRVLTECTAEWLRVLKPEGSLFVNLGDKYSSGNSGQSNLAELGERWAGGGHSDKRAKQASAPVDGVPAKSLLGLPWRYAFSVMDNLSATLRAEIIWSKPNPLPESVGDRVVRTHEQIFHFTTRERYFAATDLIREMQTGTSHRGRSDGESAPKLARMGENGIRGTAHKSTDPEMFNPLGRLPRSVWEIPSQPLVIPEHLAHARCCGGTKRDGCKDELAHYAAFPMELPRRIIAGWSPPGICTACGHGRRPVADVRYLSVGDKFAGGTAIAGRHRSGVRMGDGALATITGYACACPDTTAPTRPAIVLDPFGGTGTTALVASVLGRHGVSVDMSADYCRIARWRSTDRGEIAKAMQVRKPPKVPAGAVPLFELNGDLA